MDHDRKFFDTFMLVLGALLAITIGLFFISNALADAHIDTEQRGNPIAMAELEKRIAPVGTVVTDAPAEPQAEVAPAPAAQVALAPAPAAKAAAPAAPAKPKVDGAAIYNQACVASHGAGIAGAPKFGDKAAWAPRIKQGMPLLYEHSLKGFTGKAGMMPPKELDHAVGAAASQDHRVPEASAPRETLCGVGRNLGFERIGRGSVQLGAFPGFIKRAVAPRVREGGDVGARECPGQERAQRQAAERDPSVNPEHDIGVDHVEGQCLNPAGSVARVFVGPHPLDGPTAGAIAIGEHDVLIDIERRNRDRLVATTEDRGDDRDSIRRPKMPLPVCRIDQPNETLAVAVEVVIGRRLRQSDRLDRWIRPHDPDTVVTVDRERSEPATSPKLNHGLPAVAVPDTQTTR